MPGRPTRNGWPIRSPTVPAFKRSSFIPSATDQSHPLTDGLIEAGEPVFDAGGKYLYFLGSTDAGPVKNWFDQSNADMQATFSIYLVTLAKCDAQSALERKR